MMNDHYHKTHAICARCYACSKKGCKYKTVYPSAFRNHVLSCTQEYTELIGHDLEDEVIDSFADFQSLKASNGQFIYPMEPGLPSFYGLCNQVTDEEKEKKQQGGDSTKREMNKIGHGMDVANMKPKDVRIDYFLSCTKYKQSINIF